MYSLVPARCTGCSKPTPCSNPSTKEYRRYVTCRALPKYQDWVLPGLLSCVLVVSSSIPSQASELEGLGSTLTSVSAAFANAQEEQKRKLEDAEENFRSSDTLKRLLEQSEANKAKNAKEIANKYCYRQAELGIGDCGGLRYIPGLTKNGKQKTPKWLADLLGVKEEPQEAPDMSLEELFSK